MQLYLIKLDELLERVKKDPLTADINISKQEKQKKELRRDTFLMNGGKPQMNFKKKRRNNKRNIRGIERTTQNNTIYKRSF